MVTPDHPAHARHPASSAGAWSNCPAYLQMKDRFPDEPSAYAEAGTLAHKIAELKATKYFIGMGPKKFSSALKKLREDPNYNSAMDAATDLYLDTLKEQSLTFEGKPFVALEVRVDYGDIAPNGFGTADCIMIGDDTIVIADYKNGSGVPVDAEDNAQLKIYAYAALQEYSLIYGDSIQRVRLVIIQPHAGGVKVWETTREELEAWIRDVIVPAVAQTLEDNPPAVPGDWCDKYFCPGRAQCRARAEYMLSLTGLEGAEPAGDRQPSEVAAYQAAREINPDLPPLLSDEEVGEALTKARNLAKWIKSLEEYVNNTLLAGKPIPGWKLVAGRSSREWTGGADDAFAKLQEAGIPEAMLYERKPVTPPALEKAVGAKTYKETVAAVVTVKPGKPTLAEASDKRKEWTPAEAAFQPVETNE